MKFARDLRSIEEQAPLIFKGSFINYEALKKFLKYRARQVNAIPSDSVLYVDVLRRSDAEFLRMLAGQLREVDRYDLCIDVSIFIIFRKTAVLTWIRMFGRGCKMRINMTACPLAFSNDQHLPKAIIDDRRFEMEARSVISSFDAKKAKRKSFFLHRDPSQSRMDPKVASTESINSNEYRESALSQTSSYLD